uniref:hypothetical protein n=1 Tax=Pasteurella multocida TaxID=747 RepID=UPI0020766EA5|nr:hypothetical protein [Pasteurella multocida]
MLFIKLKQTNGNEVLINITHIKAIYPFINSQGVTSTDKTAIDIGSSEKIIIAKRYKDVEKTILDAINKNG